MHGHHSLLNMDLAQQWHKEQIASAERRQAIIHLSSPSSRSRFSDVRRLIGSSLISVGERLRPSERSLIVDDVWEDTVSIKLAR